MKWVLLLWVILLLPLGACASGDGPWEPDRYLNQARSIRALYGDAIVPIAPAMDGASHGTAFFVDDETGYFTARHVLEQLSRSVMVGEGERKVSMEHQADEHIYLSDWVVFHMDTPTTPEKGLRYDPSHRVAPGDVVYVAGYPGYAVRRMLDGMPGIDSNEMLSFDLLRELPLEIIPGRVADLRYERLDPADHLQDYLIVEDPSGSGRDYGGLSGGPVIVRDADTGQWKAIGLFRGWVDYDQDNYLLAIRPRLP